jgi:methylaspartate mutase sigma subunit
VTGAAVVVAAATGPEPPASVADLSAPPAPIAEPSAPVAPPAPVAGGTDAPLAVVSTLSSDAHTWNLVYLQLLIEEHGFRVANLGPCVPEDMLVARCCELRPQLVVISSVNGHGHQDGLRAIARLRARPELAGVPVVIGGKLGVSAVGRSDRAEALLAAGYDAVYDDAGGTESFLSLVASLAAAPAAPASIGPASSAVSANSAMSAVSAVSPKSAASAVSA